MNRYLSRFFLVLGFLNISCNNSYESLNNINEELILLLDSNSVIEDENLIESNYNNFLELTDEIEVSSLSSEEKNRINLLSKKIKSNFKKVLTKLLLEKIELSHDEIVEAKKTISEESVEWEAVLENYSETKEQYKQYANQLNTEQNIKIAFEIGKIEALLFADKASKLGGFINNIMNEIENFSSELDTILK